MIFVNSMSDLFHENAPEDAVVQIWKKIMEKASWHTFQVLTKRPERMCKLIDELRLKTLPNLWLGTSIENKDVLHRIDALKNIAAYIKFISFEPLIGPVTTVDLRLVDWVIVGGNPVPEPTLFRENGSMKYSLRPENTRFPFSNDEECMRNASF